MTLTGFWRMAYEHAGASYVSYARQQYNGADTVIDIQRGGHYELHLHLPTISDFVLNIARYFHTLDLEPAETSNEDAEMDPIPEADQDEETSLLQSGTKLLIVSTGTWASYTDEFLDRTWALTPHGEQELAMANGIAVDDLRLRWIQINAGFGIPRPVDVANYIIYRPPHYEEDFSETVLTVARFDDPFALPLEIQAQWPDLLTQPWHLIRLDDSITAARTPDTEGWSFVLVTRQQGALETLRGGILEIVSRFFADEHSVIFAVLLPRATTWAHLWSWLHLGATFPVDNVFQIYVNGELQTTAHDAMDLQTGYFIQIVASAITEESFVGITRRQLQNWRRNFGVSPATGHGLVFRAAMTTSDSAVTMLPYYR